MEALILIFGEMIFALLAPLVAAVVDLLGAVIAFLFSLVSRGRGERQQPGERRAGSGAARKILIVLLIISFGLVALAQSLFPLWAYHPASAGLRVHLSNGLYANAVFDRLIKGHALQDKSKAQGVNA